MSEDRRFEEVEYQENEHAGICGEQEDILKPGL